MIMRVSFSLIMSVVLLSGCNVYIGSQSPNATPTLSDFDAGYAYIEKSPLIVCKVRKQARIDGRFYVPGSQFCKQEYESASWDVIPSRDWISGCAKAYDAGVADPAFLCYQ